MYGYGRTIFGYGRTRAKVMDVHLGKSFRNHKKIDTKFKTHIYIQKPTTSFIQFFFKLKNKILKYLNQGPVN